MKKVFNFLVGGMVFMGMTWAISTSVFADAKVDEQVMVPKIAGVGCRVGPNGLHIACVVPKGSHSVIYFDGVEQPRFDALLLPTGSAYTWGTPNVPYAINDNYGGPIVFSPDGTHWAYLVRQGDNYVVLKDGQQIDSAPYSPTVFGTGGLMFSPAGNHLYYIICDNTPNNSHMRFMMDGKAEPWSRGLITILFSPDGAHYTYTGVADDNTTQWSVIDGQQGHFLGDHVQFTNNNHLLSVYYNDTDHTNLLIADGKPVMKAAQITQIWVSPKGGVTLAEIRPKQTDQQVVLTVNRQLVPGTEGSTIRGVYFSPDDKHYAAIMHASTGGEYILEDGKKGDSYPSINNSAMTPTFSPDSSKFLYVAQSGQQNFLVTNGDESDGFQDLTPKPVFTPDSKHLAYGTTPFGSSNNTVYVDGKALPVHNGQPLDSFKFSPDGSRNAFRINNGTLVIDGADVSNMYTSTWQKNNTDSTITVFGFLFSPDSKHITYIAQDPNNVKRGLWLDQTLVFKATQYPDHIGFSSDSQHLFWTVREAPDAVLAGTAYHHTLYVDGKKIKEYQDSFFDPLPGAWETEDNGTLQFYAIADDNIKRFTITPGADTNVSTLLASAASAK